MKKILMIIALFSWTNLVLATEPDSMAPDSVKISKKVIAINKEALREPAANNESKDDAETLSEAMEKVEEPKLWFEP